MKKQLLLLISSIALLSATAQTASSGYPGFPQNSINNSKKIHSGQPLTAVPETGAKTNTYHVLQKMQEVKHTHWADYTHHSGTDRVLDTLLVGLVPHDTVVITGPYAHNGPIYIFNDGVLIFYHASVINYGDLIVFQHGRVLSDSSSLTFPQTYFYQRSIIVVQNGIAYFSNTSFNYSGMQHSLVITDSAQVGMNNVHQNDWTTAGLSGHATMWMHGVNLAGEYILSDSCTAYFNNADTLLLWHKIPETSVINYAFPPGASVMGYQFNNTVPGVSGVNYNVGADSCHEVWWGLMPVNGSDVTLSNSNIRAIGCWFQHGDTATVSNVFDNTTYTNTVMPFTDRNMHLINTYVQTWSLYVFDSSGLNINNSMVGEVGTQQTSRINAQSFVLDGSGGYFWATDSSAIIASDVLLYSTARSEKNGIFYLGYSTLLYSTPTSIGTSIFISDQNTLPADPLPYDASTMWMQCIETPSIAHADSLIPVKGSEWIDQGPAGGTLNYSRYSLYYQLSGASTWIPLVIDSAMEIRHNTIGTWNTTGLSAGTYILRLVVKDTYADSVEAFKAVSVLPAAPLGTADENSSLAVRIFPNPATDQLSVSLPLINENATVLVRDLFGKVVLRTALKELQSSIDISSLAAGAYILEVTTPAGNTHQKFVKK